MFKRAGIGGYEKVFSNREIRVSELYVFYHESYARLICFSCVFHASIVVNVIKPVNFLLIALLGYPNYAP